jgi:hypothetical protein
MLLDSNSISLNSSIPVTPKASGNKDKKEKDIAKVAVMLLMLEAEAKDMKNSVDSKITDEQASIQYLKKAYQEWLNQAPSFDELEQRLDLLKKETVPVSVGPQGNAQAILPDELCAWIQQEDSLAHTFDSQIAAIKDMINKDTDKYNKNKADYDHYHGLVQDLMDELVKIGQEVQDIRDGKSSLNWFEKIKKITKFLLLEARTVAQGVVDDKIASHYAGEMNNWMAQLNTNLQVLDSKGASFMGQIKTEAAKGGVEALKNVTIYQTEESKLKAMIKKASETSESLGSAAKSHYEAKG